VAGAAAGVDRIGAAADQVPEPLLLGARRQAEAEGAGPMKANELLGVAAVGLHPSSRLARGERGGDDVAGDPDLGEQAIGRIAAGACLVAEDEALGPAQALDEPPQVALGVGDLHQLEAALAGVLGLKGGDDRALVDVEGAADPDIGGRGRTNVRHGSVLLRMRLWPRWASNRARLTRDLRSGGRPVHAD
jgi:hypothetical protein